jgi:hypothetical protein
MVFRALQKPLIAVSLLRGTKTRRGNREEIAGEEISILLARDSSPS